VVVPSTRIRTHSYQVRQIIKAGTRANLYQHDIGIIYSCFCPCNPSSDRPRWLAVSIGTPVSSRVRWRFLRSKNTTWPWRYGGSRPQLRRGFPKQTAWESLKQLNVPTEKERPFDERAKSTFLTSPLKSLKMSGREKRYLIFQQKKGGQNSWSILMDT
jgi:hypothetical protein